MTCPTCGRPMQAGHITGTNMLRIIPDTGVQKKTEKHASGFTIEEFRQTNLGGWPLDIPYAGMAPWVSARYCLPCRKVICQLDIAVLEKEECE